MDPFVKALLDREGEKAPKPLTFFLFSGPDYYPGGGMSDFVSAHPSLDDAEAAMAKTLEREDWAHIAELHPTEGLVIVKRATRDDD